MAYSASGSNYKYADLAWNVTVNFPADVNLTNFAVATMTASVDFAAAAQQNPRPTWGQMWPRGNTSN